MPGRSGVLRPALTLVALLGVAAPARAHRLEANYRLLPDLRVEIESWFDLSGDSARGARVQVFDGGGKLVAEGKTDARGVYVFTPASGQEMRVVISAGAGHRKELEIPALASRAASEQPASASTNGHRTADVPAPFADRSAKVTIKDLVLGVGFVLAAGAFVLSWRNARELRHLRRTATEPDRPVKGNT